ncbi:MAG TPA: CsgG/HfaB family protein [Candidatus Solibacter sp.]|jgi:curli biogenesis system outer membrane secretion channel CsgG|nr:CsgG/HfaB family protein [Candidatus Solibacter sp.]
MRVMRLAVAGCLATLLLAQNPPAAPKPAAPKPAAGKSPAASKPASSPAVDSVIESVKAGLSENLIIRTLQRENKPANLTPADLVKLKNAGVSENIIGMMLDPAGTPAAAAAPAAAPAIAAAPSLPTSPPPASAPASAPAVSAASAQSQKKRVIVDEFDYSAVKTQVQAVFNTQQDIGKGIRAMLVTRIAGANNLVVVERAKMNTLIKEQDMNAGNRVKQGTGARVGRISGADALLSGDIIIFGRDDKKRSVKGGGFIGGAIGAIASSKNEDKAVVSIAYRLIDAETSEVIATGEAKGESARKGSALGAMGGALGKGVAGVQVDMTSSNFAQTIIGEATQDCVNKLADILKEQSVNMKKTVREVETTVVDVSGNTLMIGAGGNEGVNAGEVFEIHEVLREVKDPTTKEVLDRVTNKVGEMTVTNVRDKVSTGSYAGSPAKVGFVARKRI